MANKKENISLKEELQAIQDTVYSKNKEKIEAWKSNPYVKAGMYVTGALIVVWASQYVFAAFEGAVRQFKKLRKTIKEK